ncbi:MAG TPA: GPP34 family phosphoprotein [Bacteroidales bacterium]|nr:GPP34 family phosphoprotein [Bacteroidales bacterium]
MENNLSLKEKFILLAYHPSKGTNMGTNYLGYGIAGAMLLELAALKKIVIENKRVKLIDHKKTGDEQLDYLMDRISSSNTPPRVKALIFKLQGKNKTIKKPLVAKLVRKRYLRAEQKHFLIFPYYRYPSANISYRKDLEEHIRRLVLRDIKPEDPDISLLIGLAGACRFALKFFRNRQERKIATKRIKVIIKESPVDQAIDETIKAVQTAIMISVASSAAVTASAGR